MAHELDMSNGRANMMYSKQVAHHNWHGLGKPVDDALTAEEAIVAAGLDWEVKLQKMYSYNMERNGAVEVPDRFAVMRSDTSDIIGTVGKVFTPLQNKECFSFMDSVAGPGKLVRYHTAGSLCGGSLIWLLAELTNLTTDIVPGHTVKPYMMLLDGKTGRQNLMMAPTSTVIVCANTRRMALAEAAQDQATHGFVKLRHTKNIHNKVKLAQETLGLAVQSVERNIDLMKHLAKKQVNDAQWTELLNELVPVPELPEGKETSRGRTIAMKTHDKLTEYFEDGIGMDIPGVRGTGWGALNAITQYTTHDFAVKAGKKDDPQYARRRGERLFNSTLFGGGAKMNEKAVSLLVSL